MVSRYHVSTKNGDGSGDEIEDMYDSKEYRSKDQRGPNKTVYWKEDVQKDVSDPRVRRSLLRALRWQEGEDAPQGVDDPDRKSQNRNEWKRRVTNMLTSKVGMSHYQQERCQHIREEVTVQRFGPYKTEEAVLSIIVQVAEEDRGKHGKKITEREDFITLVEDCDTTMDRVLRAREILLDKMEKLDDEKIAIRGR